MPEGYNNLTQKTSEFTRLDADLFTHPSDKAAMKALKAIPGFTQVMKAFMKIWDEQQFKIINMSTNLRLSEQ
ncbi:MAG: hypothetical protein LUI12_08020 [Clostridiales bacterium]|nr:hypothetical protein [Clostridiales bacterium]